VAVRHGRLLIRDGLPGERRERDIPRVQPGFGRLVILGHAGTVTLEALRWLADVGISFTQIDRDGRLIATSTPALGDARVRRAQALAIANPTGLEIARLLLEQKLAGQQQLLTRLIDNSETRAAFEAAFDWLRRAASVDEALMAERDAALAYWTGWTQLDVRFRPSDAGRLPKHWERFGQRTSPFTGGPRYAANPANALLNYAYSILEAETRIACLIVGLDPTLGIVHADYRTRDSFALDLMEPIRPRVDEYVLDLLRTRTFGSGDFFETRRGGCRLLPPITRQLAARAPELAELVAPVAEQVAQLLADAPGSRIDRLPTPLTSGNRRAARPPRRPTREPKPPRLCKRCSEPTPSRKRVYCDTCLPHYQREQYANAFHGSGLAAIETAKRHGHDPSHSAEAERKRGATISERKHANADWENRYGKLTDLSAFEREILPTIRLVPLSRLMRATGLSLRYVSQIRRGEKTPHPRHWSALVGAADGLR
jgi:CRISPR-associated endonuclease Cas1